MSSTFFDALRKISSSQLSEIAAYSERCIDLCCKAKKLCSVCRENCVTDAIKIDGRVEIDWSRCIKCGVCAAVCPTEVFEIQSPSDNMILNTIGEASENERVVVECDFVNRSFQGEEKHTRSKSRKITVPCIGRFSETFLLQSILAGGDKIEFVKCTSDCSFSEGRSVIEEMWHRTDHLLKIFETSAQKDEQNAEHIKDVSERRRLLRETGLQAIGILLSQSTQRAESLSSSNKTPPHRAELIELAKRHTAPSILIDREKMPFGSIKIDTEKCRLHGICASVCPTDALQFLEDNQGKELSFMYGLCVGCKACVYICPEGALEMDEKIDLVLLSSPRKAIMEKKYRLCTSCGKQFTVKTGSDSSICPSCIRRWSVIEGYAEESSKS
ncbi:MAG: 4Fe-4S binding protein [Nitrososphaerales archaeon]